MYLKSQKIVHLKRHMLHITRWFLPILFMTYFGIVSFFMHVHIVNGVTIVHSHPFSCDGNVPLDHSHSSSEVQLFIHLAQFAALDGAVSQLHISAEMLLLRTLETVIPTTSHTTTICAVLSWRAPPFLV